MRRHELTEAQWERLQPLLPPVKPEVGKPNLDHRPVISGILWRPGTGAPRRDLPERYGRWATGSSRFRRRPRRGVRARIRAALQADADAQGKVGGAIHFVDGSVVRAHRHAAGAPKGAAPRPAGAAAAASGPRSTSARRGGSCSMPGSSTRPTVHVRAQGRGKPVTFVLTGGERHEQSALTRLLDQGAIERPGRGRPRLRPRRPGGDKGSSSRTVRRELARRGIRAVIARRAGEPPQRHFDRAAYRERNRVERLINRLKQKRAIATRYDKRAAHHLARLPIASSLIWL